MKSSRSWFFQDGQEYTKNGDLVEQRCLFEFDRNSVEHFGNCMVEGGRVVAIVGQDKAVCSDNFVVRESEEGVHCM